MTTDELLLRRAIVLGSAVVYWAGVWIQARRVRKRIGRSPNLKPRGRKEKLLWAGWCLVIVVWLVQPLFAAPNAPFAPVRLHPALLGSAALVAGSLAMLAGYAGTLWCYAAMGDAWRIGINRKEKNSLITNGPYRFIRHPIYAFQVVMLAAALLLLPSALSLLVLVTHLVCVEIKAADEETHLLTVHGEDYRTYLHRSGRLFPRLGRR